MKELEEIKRIINQVIEREKKINRELIFYKGNSSTPLEKNNLTQKILEIFKDNLGGLNLSDTSFKNAFKKVVTQMTDEIGKNFQSLQIPDCLGKLTKVIEELEEMEASDKPLIQKKDKEIGLLR